MDLAVLQIDRRFGNARAARRDCHEAGKHDPVAAVVGLRTARTRGEEAAQRQCRPKRPDHF